MPLHRAASGLRQLIHTEDPATEAIATAKSSKAANAAYSTTGPETRYREMVGRIVDGLCRKQPARDTSLVEIAMLLA